MRLVFTAAVMDMFHYGHANLLKRMNEKGDLVCVVLHEGFTTFQKKGKFPIESLERRTKNLIDTGLVDIVKFTYEAEPITAFENIIKRYKDFDLLFMRADDWLDFPGKSVIDKHGIKIEYVPYTEGISSTQKRNAQLTNSQEPEG